MLKFINLENGSIYSGIQPYIHWFPGQQSTGINYVMPIALLFDGEDNIDYINVECGGDVFYLLDLSKQNETIINDFKYIEIDNLKSNNAGFKIDETFKIAILYIGAKSDSACECIDEIIIKNNDGALITKINVGADFYNEDESLKINASNLGIHIPDSIQRAIYESDVHEETIDNILINRKLKELLSNYWDVIANRGSYKSLINSLKWFEYGDLVRLREIWSHNVDGSFEYDDREVSAIMNEKYKDAFNNFYKTTSFAIYLALQHETGELDIEKNPVLAENIFKWALNDLAIKMSLLGNFYETYFMPIHTELLHCSIEDRVYTNNIKISNNVLNSCHDIVDCIESFKCIVNNGEDIILGNVNAQVCESTPFVGENSMVGVSSEPIKDDVSSDKYFYNQYYNGIGSIIPITCEFDVYGDERIVFGKIVWNGTEACDYRLFANEPIFTNGSKNGKVTINFHLLVTKPTNKLNLFFISTSGKHYTKQIDIIARDNSYINLDIYRLKHVDEPIDSKYANPSDDDFIQYSSFSMGENGTHNFEYFISYKDPFTLNLSGNPTYIYTIGNESYKNPNTYQNRLREILNSVFNKTESLNASQSISIGEIDNSIKKDDLESIKSLISNERGIGIKCNNFNIPSTNNLDGITQISIPIKFKLEYNNQTHVRILFEARLVGSKNNIISTYNGRIDYTSDNKTINDALIFNINKDDLSKYSSIGLEIRLLQPSQDIYNISSFDWMFFENFKVELSKVKFLSDGVALSNVVFMDAVKIRDNVKFDDANAYINKINTLNIFKENIWQYYFIYIPPTVDDKEPEHIVLISKYFYDDIYKYINNNGKEYIKFQDLRYIERFHTKEPIGDTNVDDSNDSLEKYCVGKYDDLFVTPQIHIGDKVYPLLYQHPQNVKSVTWKFINKSLNEESSYSDPREPHISSNSRKILDPGYYDIEFNYSLIDGTSNTITKNSAFLKLDK